MRVPFCGSALSVCSSGMRDPHRALGFILPQLPVGQALNARAPTLLAGGIPADIRSLLYTAKPVLQAGEGKNLPLLPSLFGRGLTNGTGQRILNHVHIEVMRLNTVVTSRQQILQASRTLVRQRGWESIGIRTVANACGVSIGSIYNYFSNKGELVAATVESIWAEIFQPPEQDPPFADTLDCISWLYRRMAYGAEHYPGFFNLHAASFAGVGKEEGKRLMQQTWQHIPQALCGVLRADPKVRPGALDGNLSAEQYADILFAMLFCAMLREDYDPTPALELTRRTLYE